ncbi:MAG TPA: hypothetical protein DEB30_02670 [Candidatus Peribacter riflensis]|uniref:Transglutaminase domain-containing protein n=1 Tax=Candidatus Peribacter riflensis TaxID=1735162 RepID=A0A0S1SNF0_9BACT|nr:MAG: transglutaminase domain-containing protein [Candidatus Peribacter riflensis]OGJ77078.1 MAG: hypothetical protein A2398_03065 [Candidatus Peribacteria bacterium RIFOXYB1_FULL_57_12]OGJ81837.1 MAG: hypothetical protein A2412_03895 [Candidatus Peribacteria bacterium RIFOXYC1_FULL_58_8]ALM11026.1 MAG: transglutaminase domain-containing protein [Candidatus Peribacter riflensis]ALM12129.1 MAG: transglutaminase domain-containing protein [Candidatus Peribacter riflensis]
MGVDQPFDASAQFQEMLRRFRALSEVQGRRAVYEFVRDIAYGDIGSRSAFDVLLARKGTCSGKHALLKMFFESLGYRVQNWFAEHDFGSFPIHPWPPELREFQGKTIPDFHDFLKVHIAGQWTTVDAVFDAEIVRLGFPALQWDGQKDMKLPVRALRVFPAEEPVEDHKKALIASLAQEMQTLRKTFLSLLTSWLERERLKS